MGQSQTVFVYTPDVGQEALACADQVFNAPSTPQRLDPREHVDLARGRNIILLGSLVAQELSHPKDQCRTIDALATAARFPLFSACGECGDEQRICGCFAQQKHTLLQRARGFGLLFRMRSLFLYWYSKREHNSNFR